MARTAEGRRLTQEHKLAQIRLGGAAAALTAANARRLDPNDLDGTEARWMAAQVAIVETLRTQSQKLAEDYLRAFWKAEGIAMSMGSPHAFWPGTNFTPNLSA